jgi:hypothetical protein
MAQPLLKIAGIGVELSDFSVQDSERIGDWGRAFDGGAYSQVRAEKRVWSATTYYLLQAELAAIKTAVANDAVVVVENDIDGIAMYAMVRVTEEIDWQASSDGLLRRGKLTIREA